MRPAGFAVEETRDRAAGIDAVGEGLFGIPGIETRDCSIHGPHKAGKAEAIRVVAGDGALGADSPGGGGKRKRNVEARDRAIGRAHKTVRRTGGLAIAAGAVIAPDRSLV